MGIYIKYCLIGLSCLLSRYLVAQDSLVKSDKANQTNFAKPKDPLTLKEVFAKAKWTVSSRTFFMSTINEGSLKDDYALASGAGLGVLTKSFYGFQFGLSGYFIYNLMSSNIDVPDSLTLTPNRYELGLFDVTNPTNKNNLYRLEELYLKYTLSKSSITVGKMNLNTPFFNPQNGRMCPTMEEGVWLSIKESKKIGFNGGWIWSVAPRSTVQWYSIQNSLGVYPTGLNENGSKSNYYNNITSSGMAIANIYFEPNEKLKINLWDGMLDNVMNTSMIEINTTQKLSQTNKLYQGVIYLHQDAINKGGNSDAKKAYVSKGFQSNVICAQFGVKNKRMNTSLNYTHITGDGRYIMPREWGKESFYTFLPRERNEGFGNVHAFVFKTSLNAIHEKLKTGVGYGYYQLPDVKYYRLNKYGMPSYHQINLDASYAFGKFLKGFELKLLAVYKIKEGETYNNLKYIYNKVNMLNFNLVLDFKI
jgi:hypothetical protein